MRVGDIRILMLGVTCAHFVTEHLSRKTAPLFFLSRTLVCSSSQIQTSRLVQTQMVTNESVQFSFQSFFYCNYLLFMATSLSLYVRDQSFHDPVLEFISRRPVTAINIDSQFFFSCCR